MFMCIKCYKQSLDGTKFYKRMISYPNKASEYTTNLLIDQVVVCIPCERIHNDLWLREGKQFEFSF